MATGLRAANKKHHEEEEEAVLEEPQLAGIYRQRNGWKRQKTRSTKNPKQGLLGEPGS